MKRKKININLNFYVIISQTKNKGDKMKRGFTMIELIFVIVILGILAAVAVPKMMATRTDAKITKARADIKTMDNEIQGFAAARGTIDSNLSKMSPTIKKYESKGIATIDTDTNSSVIMGCVKLKLDTNSKIHDINLTLSKETNSDIICQGIQSGIFGKNNELNYSLRGKRVTY